VNRRELIALLGGAASAWPLAARAQQAAVALVGLLSGGQLDDRLINAVRQGLEEGGYIEGRNIAIKYRSADGRFDRLPALAAELVADPVAVIIALFSPTAAIAAKAATGTIPIVFAIGADPVDLGLVSSLNRPGGNITGVAFFINTLGAKRLELLRELVPGATLIGFLVNPRNPTTQSQNTDVQTAARKLGIDLLILNASSERDIDAAFAAFIEQRVNGVMVGVDALFISRSDQLVGLAARHAMPAMYYVREFADAGGLISFAHSADGKVRIGNQSQDCQGAWDHSAANATGRRRRGHRVRRRGDRVLALFTAAQNDAIGSSRRFVVTRKFGRYWRHSRPERAFSPDQLGRK
jgi:putative tryptophan/tyrosine transport system substrate-binding protein